MKIEASSQVIEVMNLSEAARRLQACERTLAYKVANSGIAPDAILLLGTTRKRSQLFRQNRLQELGDLLKT